MRKGEERERAEQLDPVALTLAIWLGCMVCISGLIRLSEAASAQAMLEEASGRDATGVAWEGGQMFSPRSLPAFVD